MSIEAEAPVPAVPVPGPANPYPSFSIDHNQQPNRFWAVPIVGLIAKEIILIPVFFWLGFVSIAAGFALMINVFVVLITHHYWGTAYRLCRGMLALLLKAGLFLFGVTDRYPGFALDAKDLSFDIAMPEHPNRFFAIPLVGAVARMVLLIPYSIFLYVLLYGAMMGAAVSSFWVLLARRYPEPTHEFVRDTHRVYLALMAYSMGLSDRYPSFAISMRHAPVKVLMCLGGVLLLGMQIGAPLAATQGPVDAADVFLGAMQDGNYSVAYALSHPGLQREVGNPQGLERVVRGGRVEPTAWSFTSRQVAGDRAELTGNATFTGGRTGTIEVVLVKDGQDWKVIGFHMKEE